MKSFILIYIKNSQSGSKAPAIIAKQISMLVTELGIKANTRIYSEKDLVEIFSNIQLAKKPFVMPFQMGDIIDYNTGKKSNVFAGRNIINKVQRDGDSWEYSTDRGAWLDHSKMTLIEHATETSIRELFCTLKEGAEEE